MVNKNLFKQKFPEIEMSAYSEANYYDRLEKNWLI